MPDDKDPIEHKIAEQHKAAMDALSFLVSKYDPAEVDEADTFLSTTEISNSIHQHTGVRLTNADIFNLMLQMGYKYEPLNGLELTWLLKK